METLSASTTNSFPRYAARLSCLCPVITILTLGLLMLSGQIIARRTIALIATFALCLLVVGLILAVVALLGNSRQPAKGIFAPAIIGLVLNGALLCLVAAIVVGSRARASHQRGSLHVPPISIQAYA